MSVRQTELGVTEEERALYERDGFLVRESVFGPGELEEIRGATEEVVEALVQARKGQRRRLGSYVFEAAAGGSTIKWEGDSDVVLGIEPFIHLHPTFLRFAEDARFVEPMKGLVGAEEVGLYTEKINLKRARVGGRIPLHQDWPYWRDVSEDASRIVTGFLALDDARKENGTLEVIPGSHKLGVQPGRDSDDAFARNEMDESAFDTSSAVAVEVPAGSVIFFGPFLVHRSAPNRSDVDRRGFLLSYQPAGLKTLRQFLQEKGLLD